MSSLVQYEFMSIGLIPQPIDVVRAVVFEGGFLPPVFGVAVRPLASVGVYDGRPLPGSLHPWRAVFYEPDSRAGTTVMLSSLQSGWLTLLTKLSSSLEGQQFRFRNSPEVSDLYVLERGRCVRYVGALLDDEHWQFSLRGTPLWFEETANYQRRRIEQRVTRELLVRYASKLGWDLSDAGLLTSSKDAVFAGELF